MFGPARLTAQLGGLFDDLVSSWILCPLVVQTGTHCGIFLWVVTVIIIEITSTTNFSYFSPPQWPLWR